MTADEGRAAREVVRSRPARSGSCVRSGVVRLNTRPTSLLGCLLVNLSLAIILGYTLVMMTWGLWMSRQVKGSSDFFVAGRSLGPGLLAATFLAANIGAGSTVGAAGLGYRDGLAGWWWVGSAAVGSFFLAVWVGPRIRSIAAKHDLRTVGDYLELRYDRRVRAAVAVLLWFGSLAILSGQLIAMSWILNTVAGLPKWAGCVTGGAVVTAYFASGGLLTSVKMNVLQLTVKLAGFAIALPLAAVGRRWLRGPPRDTRAVARLLELVAERKLRLDVPRAAGAGVRHLARPPAEGVRRSR